MDSRYPPMRALGSVLALLVALPLTSFGVSADAPEPQRGPRVHASGNSNGEAVSGSLKLNRVRDDSPESEAVRGSDRTPGAEALRLADGPPQKPPGTCEANPGPARLAQPPPRPVPSPVKRGRYAVGIPSHYAGFVTNYPHVDGPSYNYYNSANEKMPLWGVASGAPSPGVENAVWIGGDYDEYIVDECPAGGGCYVAPPVDGVYRGWRIQGDISAPCSCPTLIQRCYFSANRGVSLFDLSLIPDGATVNSVSFEGVVAKQFGAGERINISQIDADRSMGLENISGTGFQFTYDDASAGHLFATNWGVSGYAVGNPVSVTLNATACADVQAALQRNWFGLGLVSGAGETSTTAYYFGALSGSASADPPQLVVDYSYVIPDAPSPVDAPAREITGDGELTCAPLLAWEIPDEAGGNPLHFKVSVSDTVPVHLEEDFSDSSRIDWSLSDYYGMVKTASHDLYDESGAYLGTDPPQVHLDPLELLYGGAPYPYARNYNVGWRYSRPFVSHFASDTWTDEDFTPDGLGDAMAGFNYTEWASYNSIAYPDTYCATLLGYPANVAAIGGYLPSGITESFEVWFEYEWDPGMWYSAGALDGIADSFFATVDPPAEGVTGVALLFTDSSDGFAYLSDLQIFDLDIYDTAAAQTVTSEVVGSSDNPAHTIRHARLTAVDDQPAGTSITYQMSNDDGASWHTVVSGTDFVFPTDGRRLRWRAILGTTSRSVTPRIYSLTVSNLLGGAPVDSALDLAHFEENATLGGAFQQIPAAGAPEHAASWYQARYHPPGLADGTWYWRVEAYAPAGTAGSGPASPVWSFVLDTDGSNLPAPLGDVLRVHRIGPNSLTLDWSLASPGPGSHYHARRGEVAWALGTLLAQGDTTTYYDTAANAPLLFYSILSADDCERESPQ